MRRMMIGCVASGFRSIFADAYTKLLMHMDGSNGGTTFVDSSTSNKSVTVVGNANTSTAKLASGVASALFDGNGDGLSFSSSADFAFGTGDFTVDMWIYPIAWGNNTVLFIVNATNGFQLGRNGETNLGIAAANVAWKVDASTLPSTGAWHHVAAVRASGTTKIYIDGTQVGSAADNTNYAQGASSIGYNVSNNSNFFNGYIDEFHVSKGIARWTSAFTPPALPYTY